MLLFLNPFAKKSDSDATEAAGDAAFMIEPSSKHKWSMTSSTVRGLQLGGVGIRVKKIGPVKAKVYSVALYLPKAEMRKVCAKIPCSTEKGLVQNTAFLNVLMTNPVPKEVKLKMCRQVSSKQMSAALSEAIDGRLKGKDPVKLGEFGDVLNGALRRNGKDGPVTVGTEFSFETKGNELIVRVNGKKQGELKSASLVQAFMGVYCDSKSVSPTLMESVGTTVRGWLIH